ncbi:hypothetical protein D3C72_1249860 [compost metagenome]
MQHVVGVALRDAHVDSLQAGAHARDGAVVVAALDIDGLHEAALPFHQVIRDIRHEIRVGAVRLAHDAVLVVAEVGGAQPQRAILLVGVAGLDQGFDGAVDLAVRVQRRFQVVIVELHAERLQVDVLFVAQVGDGKRADRVDVFHVAIGRGRLAIAGRDGLAGLEVVGDIGDVVAVVGGLGPFGVAGLEAARARLHGIGQGLDLHARVVIVELARHLVTLRVEQRRQGVAQGRLAAVAHVQRTGRVGRDEFQDDLLAGACRAAAIAVGFAQDGFHDGLLGGV